MKQENVTKLMQQLERHEGKERYIYKCPAGYWTIGVGRNLETKGLTPDEFRLVFGRGRYTDDNWEVIERLKAMIPDHDNEGAPLSSEAIDLMLRNDIEYFSNGVSRMVSISQCGEVRFCALVNMAFNLGLAGLGGFRNTLRLFNEKRYDEAADEALNSKWARKDVSEARSSEIATMIDEGEWL